MKNVIGKNGFFYLLGSLIFICMNQVRAADYSLSVLCADDAQKKELYIYEPDFTDGPAKVKIRNLENGEVVESFQYLTIGAETNQIIIWQRPNNHGGSSAIFLAVLKNGLLIGNGFGLNNARCFPIKS